MVLVYKYIYHYHTGTRKLYLEQGSVVKLFIVWWKYFYNMIFFTIVVFWRFFYGNEVSSIYSHVGDDIQFSWTLNPVPVVADIINIQNPNGKVMFYVSGTVAAPIETPYTGRIVYNGNTVIGQMEFTLKQITRLDAGVYKASKAGAAGSPVYQGPTLFVLGKPTKPFVRELSPPVVNKTLHLNCSTTSTTVPGNHNLSLRYTWNIDGVNITSSNGRYLVIGSGFSIQNIKTNDKNKTITCTGTEQRDLTSDISNIYTLDPLYGPLTVTFTPSTTSYSITEQGTIPDITCNADCKPSCSYRWTKDGQVTLHGSGSTLSLRIINRNDSGVYRCTSWNGHGTKNTSDIYVDDKYGPLTATFTPSTTSYSITEQGTIPDITCTADCYPNCNYRWTKDGQVTSHVSDSILSLRNINRNDTGVYRCTSWNDHGTKDSNNINVDVKYGPGNSVRLMPRNKTYTFIENTTVSTEIECQADCKPDCLYKWNSITTSNPLIFGKVHRSQAGKYVCRAMNEVGSSEVSTTLIVKYIDIFPLASKMTFETTQDIQLKCSAKGNHRGVVFHPWTQKIGSRLIRTFDGFNTDNETVVKIPYSGYQDVGNYTCYVYDRNGIFMKSKDVELTVNDKPVITDTIKIQEHKGNAEILVDFYSVPKPVKVDWMKEGAVISLSEKYRQSNTVVQVTLTLHEVRVQLKGYRAKLTITNVTDDDFGTYVLRIENFKGIATQQVNYQRKNQQIEKKRETNALDSTKIGIVIGASVTVAVTVTVVIIIYFARRRRINENENETGKINQKIESKYEELQVITAQEPYDIPETEVIKIIMVTTRHKKIKQNMKKYKNVRIRP